MERKNTCNHTTSYQKSLFFIIICSPAKNWKYLSNLLLSSSLTPGLFIHIFQFNLLVNYSVRRNSALIRSVFLCS